MVYCKQLLMDAENMISAPKNSEASGYQCTEIDARSSCRLTNRCAISPYYLPTQYDRNRYLCQCRFIASATFTTVYQQNYFPKTFKEWNSLPNNMYMYEISSVEHFIDIIN